VSASPQPATTTVATRLTSTRKTLCVNVSGPFYASERRGGVHQRRQLALKGVEGGY
jgi:hypothetical protein